MEEEDFLLGLLFPAYGKRISVSYGVSSAPWLHLSLMRRCERGVGSRFSLLFHETPSPQAAVM